MIKQIGGKLDSSIFEPIEFNSESYLLEADIIIIDLKAIKLEITELLTFDKFYYVLKQKEYNKLKSVIEERTNQIKSYLLAKGNLFVFYIKETELIITVQNEKNEETDIKIDLLNIIGLSSESFYLKSQKGTNVVFHNDYKIVFDFCNYSYEFIFQKYLGDPIFFIKKTNEVLGLKVSVANGNVFILPELSKEIGNYNEYLGEQRRFYDNLLALDTLLKETQVTGSIIEKSPDWLSDVSIGDEIEERAKLEKLFQKKYDIDYEIQKQEAELTRFSQLKKLFYTSGHELEAIVADVLMEIGYTLEQTENNRDDLILLKNGQVIVVEIKGVNGTAAEKHAAQLMKWVVNYHIQKDINPKGLLIVNTFRNKSLSERTEKNFPDQMIPYCKQMGIALITTKQLLDVYLDFVSGIISFDEINNLFTSTVGEINYK